MILLLVSILVCLYPYDHDHSLGRGCALRSDSHSAMITVMAAAVMRAYCRSVLGKVELNIYQFATLMMVGSWPAKRKKGSLDEQCQVEPIAT